MHISTLEGNELMNLKSYETLRFGNIDRVLTITIDAPGPVNAVNEVMHRELASVFLDAQDVWGENE